MYGDFTLRNTSVYNPPKQCDICLRPLPINETRGLCIVCRNAVQRRHENLFHKEKTSNNPAIPCALHVFSGTQRPKKGDIPHEKSGEFERPHEWGGK